ncbi:MAG TPA: S8 family serine peptidase, partial [Thermoplasmata archaeon]|nr:S8 family serine peptidase [Thermoplasmata archaeon]
MFLTTGARATSESTVVVSQPVSSPLVSIAEDSLPAATADAQAILEKIAPGLHGVAENPSKGFASVIVHTTDMPALSAYLASTGARRIVTVDGELRSVPFVARPWGAVGTPTSVFAQLPERSLMELAGLAHVLYVDEPRPESTTHYQDAAFLEEQRTLQSYISRVRTDVKTMGPAPLGTSGPGVSPSSWGVVREHKAWDAWNVAPACCMGDGVNVAVIDTGEDFGNPALQGQWAVAPSGAWAGWPIMFHPASMEGLMGQGWWTAGSDFDRLPLPYWLSANDGDSWYTNMDYTANDTDLNGFLVFADLTTNPETGLVQRTARENPQQYGNAGPTYNNRIARDYFVGCAGLPGACIQSASGYYRLGLNRDDTLTGLYGQKIGVLLVDSTTAGVYDTVFVDLNFNNNFTDDKAVTRADPIAVADLNGDGISDVSGGLLYFIAESSPIVDELLINSATGSETGASLLPHWDLDNDGTMESAAAAVDVDGWFNFKPATELTLRNPGGTRYYFPGATEEIYEEYTSPVGRNEGTGFTWRMDGIETSFGPIQLMTGRSVPTNALLNGPAGDFGVSLVYDVEVCDPTFTTCNAYNGYNLNTDTGDILLQADVPDNYVVFIIYQLGTYTLEPVSGEIVFQDPVSGFPETIPAGWSLLADYLTGLPIPYSQVYGPEHGYETFIPANGDLVAFHGEFDNGQSHGSFVSSTIAATPFGNLVDPQWDVFGTAPHAKIIGIAACCNVPGPVGLFGSIEDQRTFAAVGYDGRPETGDEAVILSNSFGSTTPLNSGWTWEDRWLIDFWYRYPKLTTLIALGNNGPGYATSAPGGSSPGVIGVGAGTSMDYRTMNGFLFDGGNAAGEQADCSLAGTPPDPRLCVGVGSPFGPGPYGDNVGFSSRGPTLLGTPKPDIVSVGAFGLEAAPMNVYCFGDPADCDGNFAWDLFSGTSQATPVTAGVTALVVQAYRVAHGGQNPTNNLVKELLKSGADDMHRDVLQQGAGWTNALRSVKSALDTPAWTGTADGVTSNTDHWVPGAYQGARAIGFTKLMAPGSTDSTQITLTNRNQGAARTVQVSDGVYQRVARYAYTFTWGAGAGVQQILRPTNPAGAAGLYAADGTTLLQAMPFDTFWSSSDFVKATYTYDPTVFTGGVNFRLDTFNWYDRDGNNAFALGTERVRMNVQTIGGGSNSIWETARLCCNNILTGWDLNPRSGTSGGATIPGTTLIVEFYEKADWGWIRVYDEVGAQIPFGGNVLITGADGTRRLTLTADVPAGTPPGMYEGAFYVNNGGDLLTVPIVINVPVSAFPVRLGGNVPATSLFDNSGIIAGSRSTAPWQQTGDNRYIYATVDVVNAIGRSVIYQSIL